MNMRTKKIQAGIYEYTDSNGKVWLLQNQGYYFQYQANMWSAYGEIKETLGRWNAADLVLSDSKKRLIEKIERKTQENKLRDFE